MAQETGMKLIVHQNPECVEKGINPFEHGLGLHTDMRGDRVRAPTR